MKSRGSAATACLYPAPEGWCIRAGKDIAQGPEAGALWGVLPTRMRVEVLMPSAAVVLDRFVLPRAPREDLVAMAQLQLEKRLPYASDEFAFELQEVGEVGEQVEVATLSVSLLALESVCGALRKAGRGPVAIGVYAQQLAAGYRDFKESVLLLWKEGGKPYMAVVDGGRLEWLEGLPVVGVDGVEMELSQALLGAELAGVKAQIRRVVQGIAEPGWSAAVREVLPGVAMEECDPNPAVELQGSWMPAQWAAEEEARERGNRLVERLQWVGVAYLGALAVGFGWLAIQKAGLRKLDQQIMQLQPRVEESNRGQNRWLSLQPAVDPSRFLVEILSVVKSAIGTSDIRITEFEMRAREFSVSGEASTLAEAIEYAARLKKEPGLSGFQIQAPNPNILPNERAQFRIKAVAEGKTAGVTR